VSSPRTNEQSATLKVLVYSDDVDTRQQVMLALGKRPHPDLPELEYVEVATEPVVIQQMDVGGLALAILDGEAVPGRVQDNWLATWSRADGVVSHPLDPIELAETVIRLLRSRVPAQT